MTRHRFYFGLAALFGTFVLFLIWLANYNNQAAIKRLEKYEIPRTVR